MPSQRRREREEEQAHAIDRAREEGRLQAREEAEILSRAQGGTSYPAVGIDAAGAMFSGVPTRPGPGAHRIYVWDQPWRWAVPQPPYRRPGALVDVDTLRRIADREEIVRACILHLKREVSAVPLQIVAREPGSAPANQRRIKKATEFFDVAGGLGGVGKMRQDFEGALVEDLLVVGAGAVHFHPNRGGGIYQVMSIDAGTIRPRVDNYGFPGPGSEVFEQWVYGVKVVGLTYDDLHYSGLSINCRSYSPYYASAVEYLLNTVVSALAAQDWNTSWLLEGSAPGQMVSVPESWTPDQIERFQDYFDAMLAGNTGARQRVRIVPGGTKDLGHSRHDQDFQEFLLWLARITGAIMGVQLASVGFVGEQYKTSQNDSMESTSAFGVGSILAWLKALYDYILTRAGFPDLQVQHVQAREEKALDRADRNAKLVLAGIITSNEARQEEGRPPIRGADVLFLPGTQTPMEQLLKEPAPVGEEAQGQKGPSTKEDVGEDVGEDVEQTQGAEEPSDQRAEATPALVRQDLDRWERKSLARRRSGRLGLAPFRSDVLPGSLRDWLEIKLSQAETAQDIRLVFDLARERMLRAEFQEEDHPRDEDGKFTDKDGETPATFGTPSAADDWLRSLINDYGRDLSSLNQQASLTSYKESGYQRLNSLLRNGGEKDRRTVRMIDNLDNAIQSVRTDRDVTVYRQMFMPGNTFSDWEGKTVQDAAYVSTSVWPDEAMERSRERGSSGVLWEIRVPAGSAGFPLDTVEDMGEHELLLPRGSKFQVLGVSRAPEGFLRVKATMQA